MRVEKKVLVEVNGKTVVATVTVDIPGLTLDDHVSPDMVLTVAATGQNLRYCSRHNKDKVAKLTLNPTKGQVAEAYPPLRRVA